MAKQNINVGTAANDKKGDSLRAAFQKVNANFTELYTELGLVNDVTLSLGAFEFAGSTISTTDSTAIVIDQATTVTSNLNVGGDILPQTANGGDLGSSTLPWRSLYVSNNTIFLGGTALSVNGAGNLLVNGSLITGGTTSYNDLSDKPNLGTYATQNDINTVLNEIDTRVTTLSYNDLLDKPNLADTFSFNVAADDSTQRAISNNELIKFTGAGGITTASDAEGNITINYVQGDIRSDSNINIDINLADSTLRRWQFGEDGSLTLPIGVSIDNNVDPLYPKIIADSGKLFSVQGQGSTGSAALAWSVDPNADTKYAAVGVSQGGGDNLAKVVLTAGNTTATLKVWKLDETGVFTLPTGGVIADAGNYIKLTPPTGSANQSLLIYPTAGDGNHIHLTAGGGSTELYLGNDIHYVKLVNGGNVEVRANNGVNSAAWTFSTDGDLTVPGDIKSTANTSIIIDGGVLFANVTVQSVDSFGAGVWRMFISSSAYPTLGTIVQVGDTATLAWNNSVTATITSIVQDIGAGTWALHTNQNLITGWYQNPDARTTTINSTRVKTWTFGTDSRLTFPDGTVQTTAWTGTFNTLSVTGAVTAESFNTDQITVVGNRISTTVTSANLELECNGSGGVVINTLAEATTASTARSAGYLGIPASAVSTTATLTIADAGEHIYVTTNSQTITIPANASVAYPIGTTLTFIAGPSATTVTIAITSDTLRLAGGTSTGTRTLAANGMATAVKVAATTWYINGTGLT